MLPELDADAGAVLLPYDKFVLSLNETFLISEAATIELLLCARDLGLPVGEPEEPVGDPVYDSEGYFGPWTVDQARNFAFVTPSTEADLVAHGLKAASDQTSDRQHAPPFAGLTDAQMDVVGSCTGANERSADFEAAQQQDGPWVNEFASLESRVLRLEVDGQDEIFDDLVECYESNGLRPSDGPEPWIPRGAVGSSIDAQQIKLAVAVVDCKKTTEFTERMATVHAQAQAEIVAKYADELAAERLFLDAVLEDAQSVVASNVPPAVGE